MKIKEILDFLNGIAPMETAEHYDNVGLLVGNPEDAVKGILVSLDCFDEVIDRAEDLGANLIVTHHPIIFNPLKTVLNDSLIYKLISKNISVISMHTNLDIAEGGVNDVLCEAIGLYDVRTVAAHDGFLLRVGELDGAEDPYSFARHLKEVLGGTVKYVVGNRDIKTVMVCSGSGSGVTFDAIAQGVDAFVTAEVKHSHFIAAAGAGLSLFDAGHFNTENVIVASLSRDISGAFPEIPVNECHFSKIESI